MREEYLDFKLEYTPDAEAGGKGMDDIDEMEESLLTR